MGTNYYHYKEKIKESNENSNEGLHIGKNSWGWVFHFEAHKVTRIERHCFNCI